MPIPGATGPSLVYCGVTRTDDGAQFTVEVSNSCSVARSRAARLSVNADTTAPAILSVSADCDKDELTVRFDDCIDPSTATDPFQYWMYSAGRYFPVIQTFPLSSRQVLLLSGENLVCDTSYTLFVDIDDQCHNFGQSQANFICPCWKPEIDRFENTTAVVELW